MTEAPMATGTRTAWVASVAHDRLENWAIAKESGLWGTANGLGRNVRAGDELFLWQSQRGWLARCLVMSDAYPVAEDTHVPWVDGVEYRWLFDIAVVTEVNPFAPRVVDRRQVDTGIPTVYLSRFSGLNGEQSDALRAMFPDTPVALSQQARVGAVEPTSGWGRGRDRERNKLIEQAGINAAIAYYEQHGYSLSADRQKDGVGYDLEFTINDKTLKVEVKGIAGVGLAFNLTAKERRVANTDGAFRLCAVTSALGDPLVEELTGAQLERLTIEPTQYRVSRARV